MRTYREQRRLASCVRPPSLRIWGSKVRILPGAPVYETSRVNRTAFTRTPYPGNREHARPISNRSDYESGGREFESLRARHKPNKYQNNLHAGNGAMQNKIIGLCT